jgi:hypothetical protein
LRDRRGIRFFSARDHNGMLEQVFAVSQDGRAVKWRYDKPGWQPLTPSSELARQVAGNASLELLDQNELQRLWELTDPPRNFSLEWRIDQRWEGRVTVGLALLPGIPLWFFWDELWRWSGGYGETVAGVVIFLQAASLLLLRPPVMRRIHDLSRWLDARRKEQRSDSLGDANPALSGIQDGLREMPKERVRELASMAADLARLDREQNVRVALRQMQGRQARANPPQTRFFLVDGSIPALAPEPGSMFLLRTDGTWGSIVPSEVLGDEGSPEVSEETFVLVVARLGASMPGVS